MKKFTLILIIILSSFSTLSQSLSDSTKLSNSDIKTLLQIGDEWKKMSKEIILLNDRNDILQQQIFVRDSLIASQKSTITGYDSIVLSYQSSEKNLIQQRTNLQIELKAVRKKAKWNNTKSFITSAALVAVGILYILK